ncbi:MAG TPA: phosphatase PAP2 family protein [Thermoanaerobaculia bacterium]|nr:phosphatase PAP2 family protein [Thermoanaerobaculia bacterium]
MRFVAWPGWRHLRYAALWMLLVNVLFVVVYFGTDTITARRAHHLHLFAAPELAIPLWAPAIVVYDSLYFLFLLAPFVLRTRDAFRALAWSAAATIVIAGVCFLLFPAELGFAPPSVDGSFRALFNASDRLNLDYNLVPSLHVALAVLCLLAFWPAASMVTRVALALWGVSLAASTLLTHQHHALDVATGALLAAFVFAMVRRTIVVH